MTSVVILASADRTSQSNLERTVFNEVDIDLAERVVAPADSAALRHVHPSGRAAMWGIWPAKDGRQTRKWQQIRPGDTAAFSGPGGLVAAATVAHVFRSPRLARSLWGVVERDGQEFTYELMFSLRDVRTVFVPYEDLNPMLGWSAAATVREANVYSADRAAGLIDALGGSGPQTPQNLQREPPGVQVLPVEARDVESYVLQRPNEPSTAVRREAELVQTYVMWRSASGAETCRHGIRFPEGTTLYTDLFDIELDELLEAKASSARHHVRTGLGQILDYSRFVSSRSRALLLPDEPIDDLKELLTQNHVAVVWPHGDGFVRLEPQSEDNLVAAEADA